MFEKSYAGVVELINDCQFDEIREKYDELYREENGLYDELWYEQGAVGSQKARM